MLSKIIHVTVAIIFVAFAVVQYNDSDGFKWIAFYLIVALLPILRIVGKSNIGFNFFLLGLFSVLAIMNFSSLTDWIAADKPAFIDYEPTHIKAVEGIREYLGIMICLITILIYTLSSRKKIAPQ